MMPFNARWMPSCASSLKLMNISSCRSSHSTWKGRFRRSAGMASLGLGSPRKRWTRTDQGVPMYKHVAETFVCTMHAQSVAEKICVRIKDFCRPVITSGSARILDFGDGRAIIRPTNDGLFFRVSAQDLVTFYGICTLLQGSLSLIAPVSESAIEWLQAGSSVRDRQSSSSIQGCVSPNSVMLRLNRNKLG